MSAAAAGFIPFNPVLAESEFEHRAAVDCLKWQLGQPLSAWSLLPPPLCLPRPPYYYCDDFYYNYYYGDRLDRLHYSQGYRDGLSTFARGGSETSDGSKFATAAKAPASPTGAAASQPALSWSTSSCARKSAAAGYPGDLMEFPSASYRRPVGPVPLSTCTSYDDLTFGWPYGCKPFYYRRADPPSVRYC